MKRKSVGLAVFLSLLIPGVGQFYCRALGKGLAFLILTILFAIIAAAVSPVVLVVNVILWIWAMADAGATARRINRSSAAEAPACSNCYAPIPTGAAFCPSCGVELRAASPASGYQYELEVFGDQSSRGLVVKRVSDGQRLNWQSLPASDGLRSLNLVGEKYRLQNLQGDDLTPGKPLTLVREPDNPHGKHVKGINGAVTVAVWDGAKTRHLGYLADSDAAPIARMLDGGVPLRCISMWETLDGDTRTQLRCLILESHAFIR